MQTAVDLRGRHPKARRDLEISTAALQLKVNVPGVPRDRLRNIAEDRSWSASKLLKPEITGRWAFMLGRFASISAARVVGAKLCGVRQAWLRSRASPGAASQRTGIALSCKGDARKVAAQAQGARSMGQARTQKRVRTEARQQRLAAELRANLAKRKAQTRAQARAAAERAPMHQVADNANEKGR